MDDSISYEMKNHELGDRLSELPDSLIFNIFWFLPMAEVVRTSLLSPHWKNLWTIAPNLNFEHLLKFDATKIDIDKIRNFVNRSLMLWRGMRIQQFAIEFGYLRNKSLYNDIDLWLRFAAEYDVEALYVDLDYDLLLNEEAAGAVKETQEALYHAPQCLYSCSSLKKLYLRGCNLRLPTRNVKWNHLKLLRIDGYAISECLIDQILSGCAALETLILYVMESFQNLCIKSSSLRDLSVCKYLYFGGDDPSVDSEVTILAPNLQVLNMLGVPYSKCLMNVPSLVDANLLFDGPGFYSNHLFSGNDFVGEALMQILPAIQHVEQVALSDWCVKALGAINNKCMLSPFPNVKVLELNGCLQEYQQIVHLLEIFPQLERLVLQHEKAKNQSHDRETIKSNLSNSFLQHLTTVMITWYEGEEDSMLPFIEIVLKYASKLEKMEFRVKETPAPSNCSYSLLFASEILEMPRSSPAVELIFL